MIHEFLVIAFKKKALVSIKLNKIGKGMKFEVKLNDTIFELDCEPNELNEAIIKRLELKHIKFKLKYFDKTANQYKDVEDLHQLRNFNQIMFF